MTVSSFRSIPDRAPLFGIVVVLAVAALSLAADRWDMAVYALSFWHYLVYGLAFFWRRIPHRQFIQDAMSLKTMSLVALAFVLWSTLPNLLSLTVMAIGFALNIVAARALGTDRTYYGFELADMPPERFTAFPFSVLSHPMLIGNMVAYGGLLLDGDFRQSWWPFAAIHVVLNAALLLMEIRGGKSWRAGAFWSAAGLVLGTILLMAGFREVWPTALVIILTCFAFGTVIIRRYS